MIVFLIKNGKLIVDAKTLTVPQFNNIWEYYEDKLDATKLLLYIFAMSDITVSNPYLDVAFYEKEEVIKNSVFSNSKHKFTKEETELINHAIPVYTKLNKDSAYRMLESIDFKIDQINRYMLTSKVNKDNITQEAAQVVTTSKMLASRAVVEEYVAKELKKTKTQGDMSRSPLETGAIGYKKFQSERGN